MSTTTVALVGKKKVTPGTAIIGTISALPGGNAEYILRDYLSQDFSSDQFTAVFGAWEHNRCEGSVRIHATGEVRPVTLLVGSSRGLFLKDVDDLASFSLKNLKKNEENSAFTIPIGRLVYVNSRRYKGTKRSARLLGAREFTADRVRDVARKILGTWMLHGRDWIDRSSQHHELPYGTGQRNGAPSVFHVEDGGAVADIASLPFGTIRSTHVGSWAGGNALFAATSGMTVLLNEFNQNSAAGRDVCRCAGTEISTDKALWPPAARWSNRSLNGAVSSEVAALAREASSPFTFHVAATRKRFQNCILASVFFLEKLGEARLSEILRLIAWYEPERFYRVIDEHGATHSFESCANKKRQVMCMGWEETFKGALPLPEDDVTCLKYANGYSCTWKEAVWSVIESFHEMARVQDDHTYVLPVRPRVVLDTHVYVVLTALSENKGGEAHHLSGRYTYDYMLKGTEALTQEIRNNRLFRLIHDKFGVSELCLVVYKAASDELSENDQYRIIDGHPLDIGAD